MSDDSDADDEVVAAYLDQIDVRSVSIIWAAEEDRPTVSFSGCSVWEAHGLALFALRVLDVLTEPNDADLLAACDEYEDEEDDGSED